MKCICEMEIKGDLLDKIKIQYPDFKLTHLYEYKFSEWSDLHSNGKRWFLWATARTIYVKLIFRKFYAAGNAQQQFERIIWINCTAWKVPILGIIMVLIFPHSDWVRTLFTQCYKNIKRSKHNIVNLKRLLKKDSYIRKEKELKKIFFNREPTKHCPR